MARAAILAAVFLLSATGFASAQPRPNFDGMWSDPPATPEDRLCAGYCFDPGLQRLAELLDDPKNDSRPVTQLVTEAARYQQTIYLPSILTDAVRKAYPFDPAGDPSFLKCQPYGLVRQILSRHQLEIRSSGAELHLRYGEWADRRTVYMDGRPLPPKGNPTRLGVSVGRYEGDALVIESTGVERHRVFAAELEVSPEIHVVERYTRSADGRRLLLTATLTDALTFKEPLVVKKTWRWAPESKILDELHCEIPTDFRKREK